MARYSLFVLKVPLNTKKQTSWSLLRQEMMDVAEVAIWTQRRANTSQITTNDIMTLGFIVSGVSPVSVEAPKRYNVHRPKVINADTNVSGPLSKLAPAPEKQRHNTALYRLGLVGSCSALLWVAWVMDSLYADGRFPENGPVPNSDTPAADSDSSNKRVMERANQPLKQVEADRAKRFTTARDATTSGRRPAPEWPDPHTLFCLCTLTFTTRDARHRKSSPYSPWQFLLWQFLSVHLSVTLRHRVAVAVP